MRKYFLIVGALVALALPAVGLAADWNNTKNLDLVAKGAACGVDGAVYHFVNSQLGTGYADGTIAYVFTGGSTSSTGPSMNNGPTQHFYVTSAGTLFSASTNLPGKLVISGVECAKK